MLTKLVMAAVLVAAAAAAQGGRGGTGGEMGEGRSGGMDRGSMMERNTARIDMWSDMLKLNRDQKKQIKTLMDEAQKEAVPVKEQIVKTRTAIAEGVAAGKSPDELKDAEAAYVTAEIRMHQIELGAFAKIYQALEKDQQTKVRPILQMMAGIFQGRNWNEVN